MAYTLAIGMAVASTLTCFKPDALPNVVEGINLPLTMSGMKWRLVQTQ
jgi:hypothetical protein